MKRKIWKKPGWYLFLLLLILSIAAVVQVVVLGVIPTLYLVIGIVALLLINLLLYFMLVSRRVNKINRILGSVLTVFVCAALVVGNLYLYKTNSLFGNITHSGEQRHELSVVVKADSDIESIGDLNASIATSSSTDADVISDFVADVKSKENVDVQTEDAGPLLDMVQTLYDDESEAILLDESYRSMISEQEEYSAFEDETKVIYTYVYYTEISANTSAVNVTQEPFTVLVTGIDTYGSIATTSRSDVNMLVTVNPVTKNIQLVSIPRDYYVETDCDPNLGCAVGEMDKLTHTGLHGADTTRATLEKLFGIDINYTLRVNFSSVENIVNALGGITVDDTRWICFQHWWLYLYTERYGAERRSGADVRQRA